MQYGILGPVEVRDGERPIPLGSSQQRVVLAALLLDANRVVSVDRLVDALWGEKPPRSATAVLKNRVSQLRKLLAPAELRTEPSGYLLRVEPDELDLHRFERLAAEGREALSEGRSIRAAAVLAEALALWRGPALADLAYDAFAQTEIARLEELRLATVEERFDADLACGRAADVIPELEALVSEHPLRERLRAQLMLALYRSGRQAEALESYQHARRTLVEELGINPTSELQTLYKQILNQDEALDVQSQPEESFASTLPVQPTPLVGRERELQELVTLLAEAGLRLLTLTGPGGVGKTRLALGVAAEATGDYAGGVFFVNLAPVDDADLVISTIAETLGLREQPGEPIGVTLREALREQELLLLLDNFEQVRDASRELAELLTAAPRLRLLVTSRAPLRISGEREYEVPPLATEEALVLFAERARAVKAGFVLNGNRTLVAEICRRLDCLPLAVELAAARIKLLPEQALLARLDERLKLLTAGARDLPERQQTLRAAIDWSYELLGAEEQTVFCRLAVFAGGRSLEAIEAVCSSPGISDPLEDVASLVDNSLIRREESDQAEPRFVMLETIHEYARERLEALGDVEAARQRHADFFLALVEEAEPHLIDHNQAGRLRELERELGNVRLALRWFVDAAQPECALRLASALLWYWDIRGRTNEGRTWLTAGLAAADELPTPVRAKAFAASGTLALRERDADVAETLLAEGQAIYRQLGDDRGQAHTLWALSAAEAMRGNFEQALSAAEEGARLAREVGDGFALASNLNSAGIVLVDRGEPAKGRSLLDEAAALWEQQGDLRNSIHARANVAGAMLVEGEAEQAAEELDELLRLGEQIGERSTRGDLLRLLGLAHLDRGALEEAAAALREGVALALDVGLRSSAADGLVALGSVLGELLGPEHAAVLWGAAEAAREASGHELWEQDRASYERGFARIQPRLAKEAWQKAWAKGRRMTLEQAAAYADGSTDRSSA